MGTCQIPISGETLSYANEPTVTGRIQDRTTLLITPPKAALPNNLGCNLGYGSSGEQG